MICLDPGITTGWAVLADDETLLATSVWGNADVKESLDKLIRVLHSRNFTLRATVEKMPRTGGISPLGQKLEIVNHEIREILDIYEIPTTYVLPGTWKNSRPARVFKVPRKWRDDTVVIHQRDAMRMGAYQLWKEKQ